MIGKKSLGILFGIVLMVSANASTELKQNYTEFKRDTEARLQKVDKQLTILTADAKKEVKEQYHNLLKIKSEIEDKLKEAETQTIHNWEEAKKVIEKLAAELEEKVEKVTSS